MRAPKELSSLIPVSADSLIAKVTSEDASTAEWIMPRGQRGSHTMSPKFEPTIMPLTDLRTALGGSEESAIRYLLPFLGAGAAFDKVLDHMAGEYSPYKELLKTKWENEWACEAELELGVAEPQSLCDFLVQLGKEKRELSSIAKKAQSALSMFSGAKSQGAELNARWRDLFESLWAERLVKLYRDNPDQRGFIGGQLAALDLDLKSLPRSASISEEVEALLAASEKGRLAKEFTAKAHEATKDMNLRKKLAEALLSGLRELVAPFIKGQFAELVSSFLPEGESVEFQFTNKLEFHLRRGGILYRALSGSTEVRVLAAIGAALGACVEDRATILLLDDRMWDRKTLARTMRALEKAPCQVIIMSTDEPAGRQRKAWTRVRLTSAAS